MNPHRSLQLSPGQFLPLLLVFLILGLNQCKVKASPLDRAEDKICTKLIPSHIRSEPATIKSPYSIYLTRTDLHPGESTSIQICSSKHKIKEFYVQARSVVTDSDEIDNLPVGTFLPEPRYENSTVIDNCGQTGKSNLIQQSDSAVVKEHVKFKWIAPAEPGVYFLL